MRDYFKDIKPELSQIKMCECVGEKPHTIMIVFIKNRRVLCAFNLWEDIPEHVEESLTQVELEDIYSYIVNFRKLISEYD